MTSTVERRKTVPDIVLLVNAALGALVLVTHGGVLLLLLSERVPAPPGYAELVWAVIPFSLPLAGLVVASSIGGLFMRKIKRPALAFQAIVIFFSSLALLVWAANIVIHGIPLGNFVWTPGFLTGWVVYSWFLCARVAVSGRSMRRSRIRYLLAVGALVAVPVDLGVFLRFLLSMMNT